MHSFIRFLRAGSKFGSPLLIARLSSLVTGTVLLVLVSGLAQAQSAPAKDAAGRAPASPTVNSATASNDISGMYTFLREGEFVEVDVEEDGRVTGFVSRYGDTEADRGAFLDHMFTKGSMQGNKLTFTTRSLHGVVYEFSGTVERGEGKSPGAEAYHVIKGTLTQLTEDKNHKSSAQQREVVLKSFPSDAMSAPRKVD